MNNDFTFLPIDLVFDSGSLDIFPSHMIAELTDFAFLLGAQKYTGIKNIGDWYTKSKCQFESVRYVDGNGDFLATSPLNRNTGARPAITYSLISSKIKRKIRFSDGTLEVNYGEYPQTYTGEYFSNVLEDAKQRGKLKETGKVYTTDSVPIDDENTSFHPRIFKEYEFSDGKKYICLVGDKNSKGLKIGNVRIVEGGHYWIEVKPITWLVDEKANIALSKYILFSGIQFDEKDEYDGDFKKTNIKKYMDKYFSKEILQKGELSDIDSINMTLLSREQVFSSPLEIFQVLSKTTECSDLAKVLGCTCINDKGVYFTSSPYSLSKPQTVCGIRHDGTECSLPLISSAGIRPVVPYSSIKKIAEEVGTKGFEIAIVQCGEYPQEVASEEISKKLEKSFLKGILPRGDKTYTFYRKEENNFDDVKFVPSHYSEFIYEGSRYIRIKNRKEIRVEDTKYDLPFPVTRIIKPDEYVWIKVCPVTWLVDEKSDLAISESILLSGVRYDNDNYHGVFEDTELSWFLNTHVKEAIFQESLEEYDAIRQENDHEVNIEGPKARKENPYNFNFDEVSEEDIIRGAIESNVSVFLHGRSSEGKSSRIKQLDPDCDVIYLRNATPDSLNGKTVSNSATGEMIDIPPTWYTKLKDRCEAEPDKIHIVFFDELTNALPSIQGMALNIILDGEVNGKWKLPPNARIAAAGNELNDSLAANQMVEPLFNRFAHVYIETDVDSWLKWASTPDEDYQKLDYTEEDRHAKIHPAIYSYVAYKAYSNEDILRTEYTGDKPNADPRKWEMASKVLYKTNKPEMLRALVGEEITADFVEFTREQAITIEDVLNHNYNDADLKMNTSQKFATAVGLLSVDEEHIEEVRDFMKKLGPEPRAAFESMWAHGDKKRLELLAELRLADKDKKGGRNL